MIDVSLVEWPNQNTIREYEELCKKVGLGWIAEVC